MTEPEKLYRAVGIYDDDYLRMINSRRDVAKYGPHPEENVLTDRPVRTPSAAKARITEAKRLDNNRVKYGRSGHDQPFYKDYRIDVVELRWEAMV